MGTRRTVPPKANRLAERAQFIKDHPGWTFKDYDEARAGDITFMREYETMLRQAELAAVRAAQEEAARGKHP